MTGKSQASYIIAKAKCELDPSTRIAVTCKSVYARLIAQGVPEINLVKAWEKVEEPLQFWYDEFYEMCKDIDVKFIYKGFKK